MRYHDYATVGFLLTVLSIQSAVALPAATSTSKWDFQESFDFVIVGGKEPILLKACKTGRKLIRLIQVVLRALFLQPA